MAVGASQDRKAVEALVHPWNGQGAPLNLVASCSAEGGRPWSLEVPFQAVGAQPLNLAVLPLELEGLLMKWEAYPWKQEAFHVEEASCPAAQHPYC